MADQGTNEVAADDRTMAVADLLKRMRAVCETSCHLAGQEGKTHSTVVAAVRAISLLEGSIMAMEAQIILLGTKPANTPPTDATLAVIAANVRTMTVEVRAVVDVALPASIPALGSATLLQLSFLDDICRELEALTRG